MSLDLSENDWKEFFRQCSAVGLKCDANTPIQPGETLEPCLRGCKKIEQDEDLIELLKNVYCRAGVN